MGAGALAAGRGDAAGGRGVMRKRWLCFPDWGVAFQGWRSLRELTAWLTSLTPPGS